MDKDYIIMIFQCMMFVTEMLGSSRHEIHALIIMASFSLLTDLLPFFNSAGILV